MKITTDKLYEIITKLMTMLEEELELINNQHLKSSTATKKDIIEMIRKLVTIIIQLSKLKENDADKKVILTAEDQQIISQFLQKYTEVDNVNSR